WSRSWPTGPVDASGPDSPAPSPRLAHTKALLAEVSARRGVGARESRAGRYEAPGAREVRRGLRERVGPASRVRLVHHQVAGAVLVDRDAGAHRRGERDLLHVPDLGRGRLGPQDLLEGGGVVFHQ